MGPSLNSAMAEPFLTLFRLELFLIARRSESVIGFTWTLSDMARCSASCIAVSTPGRYSEASSAVASRARPSKINLAAMLETLPPSARAPAIRCLIAHHNNVCVGDFLSIFRGFWVNILKSMIFPYKNLRRACPRPPINRLYR